jgi:hypothetical protein
MKKISYLDSILPELEIDLPGVTVLLKWKSLTHEELKKIQDQASIATEKFNKNEISLNQLFIEANKGQIDCINWDAFLTLPQHILSMVTEEVNKITYDFYTGKIKKKME